MFGDVCCCAFFFDFISLSLLYLKEVTSFIGHSFLCNCVTSALLQILRPQLHCAEGLQCCTEGPARTGHLNGAVQEFTNLQRMQNWSNLEIGLELHKRISNLRDIDKRDKHGKLAMLDIQRIIVEYR
jgi:hypothetical protein